MLTFPNSLNTNGVSEDICAEITEKKSKWVREEISKRIPETTFEEISS